jgi:hypothetical protein
VDKTGITVVQHKTSKVISLKGKRQVAILSSAERGVLVTVVTYMGAAGHFVPPLLVFSRKNMKPELLDGAPSATIAAYPSGWIQQEILTMWFKYFVSIEKPTPSDPVVLILDGYYSHTRNIVIIDIGRKEGMRVVCFPPHCTQKMQPLDVSFMSPLKVTTVRKSRCG